MADDTYPDAPPAEVTTESETKKKTKKKVTKKKKKKVAQEDKPIYPGGPTQAEFDAATPDQKKAMQYQARAWKRKSPRERARQKKELAHSMAFNKKRKEYREYRDGLIRDTDLTPQEIKDELAETFDGWTPKKGDRGSGGLGMRTSRMSSAEREKSAAVFNQRWKVQDAIRRYGKDAVGMHPELGPIYNKIKEEERLMETLDLEDSVRMQMKQERLQKELDRSSRRRSIEKAQRGMDEFDARRAAELEKSRQIDQIGRVAQHPIWAGDRPAYPMDPITRSPNARKMHGLPPLMEFRPLKQDRMELPNPGPKPFSGYNQSDLLDRLTEESPPRMPKEDNSLEGPDEGTLPYQLGSIGEGAVGVSSDIYNSVGHYLTGTSGRKKRARAAGKARVKSSLGGK